MKSVHNLRKLKVAMVGIEQLRENKLFRPSQIYAGERDRPYVPIDERNARTSGESEIS